MLSSAPDSRPSKNTRQPKRFREIIVLSDGDEETGIDGEKNARREKIIELVKKLVWKERAMLSSGT